MNDMLRSRRRILIILAVIVVIALALVVRGFVIGDTDYDVDDTVPDGALTS